jgi:predicted heme/steroid binding protein
MLMKLNKLIMLSAIAMVFVLVLAACQTSSQEEEALPTASPAESQSPSEQPSEEPMESEQPMTSEEPMEEKTFTLEELANYDGQDGRPAYVAVDGVVYDLTNSSAWRNGKHNGFTAGKDLTEEIKEISPHGVKNLEGIPVVGKLAGN